MIKNAVVLAGGKGTRLRPLTLTVPKPLIPVGNRPILEYIIRYLESYGVERILVVVNYLGEKVRSFLAGRGYSAEIVVPQGRPLDTADAVRICSDLIDDSFLVIMGDVLTDVDLRSFVRFHLRNEAMASVALKQVESPMEYGVIILDKSDRIVLFLEKPLTYELYFASLAYCRADVKMLHANLVNIGIYVFNHIVLDILNENRFLMDWGRHVFPFMLERGYSIYGWTAKKGYWIDVGNPQKYLEANWDLLSKRGVSPRRSWELRAGRDVEIGEHVSLFPPILLGDRVVVEDQATVGPRCVLGEGTYVSRGSRVAESVLLGNVMVSPESTVTRSVVADNVFVGRGAGVRSYCVLGEGVEIGSYATIESGVRVWPGQIIKGRGTITVDLRAKA